MNKPVAPGRIRWAILCLALGATGALPAAAVASGGRDPVQVIVQMDAGRSAAAAKAEVRQDGGKVTGDLPIINGFAAKLSQDAQTASRTPTASRPSRPTRRSRRRASASPACRPPTPRPSTRRSCGTTPRRRQRQGRRRRGHRHRHRGGMPDFRATGSSSSRVVANAVTNPDARTPGDAYGHGTHVAGIIAGNGWNRSTRTRCAASTSASPPRPT
jgi:serine protease AprX